MPRRRFKTLEVPYKLRPGRHKRVEANWPASAREFFEANPEDCLVIEEGNTFAVERAAALGPYLLVRLERAPAEEPERPARAVKPVPAATAEKFKGTVLDVRVVKPEPAGADADVAIVEPPADAGASFFAAVLKQCGRAGDPLDGKQRR